MPAKARQRRDSAILFPINFQPPIFPLVIAGDATKPMQRIIDIDSFNRVLKPHSIFSASSQDFIFCSYKSKNAAPGS
jgi:hypothetical protein